MQKCIGAGRRMTRMDLTNVSHKSCDGSGCILCNGTGVSPDLVRELEELVG